MQSLKDQVSAAEADLNTALANTHQAHAAASTVQSTRGQLANAEAQLKEAEVRLGYTKIYAPVSGTVSVRAAREGEVLTAGQPIVTLVDLGDTWVRAAIPETESDHIGLGDTLRIRLPGGTHHFRQSFLQISGSRFRHPARCEPAQARYQDHRAQGSAGQSQRRLRARNDGRGAGLAGST